MMMRMLLQQSFRSSSPLQRRAGLGASTKPTFCQKGNEEEKETFEKGSKKEKGYLTALFLMRQEAPKFCTTSESVQAESKLTYREKWMSEKEAMEKFGDDLEHHIASGRVSWRECSRTWGVYEYLDNEDYEKTTTGKKNQKVDHGTRV